MTGRQSALMFLSCCLFFCLFCSASARRRSVSVVTADEAQDLVQAQFYHVCLGSPLVDDCVGAPKLVKSDDDGDRTRSIYTSQIFSLTDNSKVVMNTFHEELVTPPVNEDGFEDVELDVPSVVDIAIRTGADFPPPPPSPSKKMSKKKELELDETEEIPSKPTPSPPTWPVEFEACDKTDHFLGEHFDLTYLCAAGAHKPYLQIASAVVERVVASSPPKVLCESRLVRVFGFFHSGAVAQLVALWLSKACLAEDRTTEVRAVLVAPAFAGLETLCDSVTASRLKVLNILNRNDGFTFSPRRGAFVETFRSKAAHCATTCIELDAPTDIKAYEPVLVKRCETKGALVTPYKATEFASKVSPLEDRWAWWQLHVLDVSTR